MEINHGMCLAHRHTRGVPLTSEASLNISVFFYTFPFASLWSQSCVEYVRSLQMIILSIGRRDDTQVKSTFRYVIFHSHLFISPVIALG